MNSTSKGFLVGVVAIVVFSCAKEDLNIHVDYITLTNLQLPFNNEWTVAWGGRSVALNYHASLVDQRFAIDVFIVENGSTHIGDGLQNEDYHCFGDTLFAPGAGMVVATRDNVSDNIPGEQNRDQLFGNYVILDHLNGEFSILAHLKKGSVDVVVGQSVDQGQVLGLAGNSGNSTEAHLHYHLQNRGRVKSGEGLPAMFRNYIADDEFIEIGEPLQNQRVRKE